MLISAIDLGATTGVAWGVPGHRPTLDSWDLRAPTLGERGLKLMRHLVEHLDAHEPDQLYVEAAPNLAGMMQRGTNIETLQSLYGYHCLVLTVAESRGLRGKSVDVQPARRWFLGFRPRAGEGKAAVLTRCRVLGWTPNNNNEADAACVWDYAASIEAPSEALKARLKQAVRAS